MGGIVVLVFNFSPPVYSILLVKYNKEQGGNASPLGEIKRG
jgi:hypothetical protein